MASIILINDVAGQRACAVFDDTAESAHVAQLQAAGGVFIPNDTRFAAALGATVAARLAGQAASFLLPALAAFGINGVAQSNVRFVGKHGNDNYQPLRGGLP